MAGESRDFSQKVKSSIDIVEVVEEYVNLKKVGKNYQALCPFHQENTPSFTVNPENQFYYCFGCGAGGDVYDFLMEIENITFFETLKILAGRAGMEIPNQSRKSKRMNQKRELFFELYGLASRFYNYLLQERDVALPAREYLQERGIGKEEIEKFELGFAPDRWRALLTFLTNKGYEREQLLEAGLISKSNNNFYDRFRNRIIFPIFNVRGEVLAFGGRIISNNTDFPKYLNSPETLLYSKGDNLYGLNWARDVIRRQGEAVIMEGYTDVLTAHNRGIENAVAALGTSLTQNQARLLERYADTVYTAFDADAAGEKATLRGLDILGQVGLRVRVIELPPGKDPDDIIRKDGAEVFNSLREKALNLMDFKIKLALGEETDLEPEKKISRARKAAGLVSGIKDPLEREVFLQKIADHLDLSLEVLQQEIEKNTNLEDKKVKNRYNKNVNKTNSEDSINKLESKLLKIFLEYPEYRGNIRDRLSISDFSAVDKNLLSFLWNNSEKNIKYIINNELEDRELRKRISALMVKEKQEVNEATLTDWIVKIKENARFNKKVKLYQRLQELKAPGLNKLNQILFAFFTIRDD